MALAATPRTTDIRWWPGRGQSVPAEVVVNELHALEAKHGMVQPEMVVEQARATDSPLHDLFTWDDTAAAEKYRLGEARKIIGSIRVTFHEQEKVAPAFLSVRVERDDGSIRQGYVDVQRALSSRQMRERVLKDAFRQLRAWQRRYRMLTELADVVAAIGRVLPEDLPDEDLAE